VAPVRLACCQYAPDVERPALNAARARDAIAHAAAGGADVIVLPELCTSGYVLASTEEARAAAVPANGALLEGWAREAARGDAIVIGGFCELGDDGLLYNSSALVDRDGVQAVYRKLHLWGEEPRWFAPGEDPAPVVQTRHGRVGLGVCYDLEFPELTRGLALEGAELIVLPTNWPREPRPPASGPVVHSLAAITAYTSRVFVAVCDRSGAERGLEFEGGSVIADPNGWLLAGPIADRSAQTLFAELDLDLARDKRTGPHNDAFADRRPDRYVAALREPAAEVARPAGA
jgi:predicted amidohydrolase